MIGVKCPKCNTEYDDVFNFCPECAEPKPTEIQQEAVPLPEVPKPKKKLRLPKGRALSIVTLSLIVVLLVTTVVFVVLFVGANSAKNKAENDLSAVSSAYQDLKATADKVMPLIKTSTDAFLAQNMELMTYGNFTARWTEEGKTLGGALGQLQVIADKYNEANK